MSMDPEGFRIDTLDLCQKSFQHPLPPFFLRPTAPRLFRRSAWSGDSTFKMHIKQVRRTTRGPAGRPSLPPPVYATSPPPFPVVPRSSSRASRATRSRLRPSRSAPRSMPSVRGPSGRGRRARVKPLTRISFFPPSLSLSVGAHGAGKTNFFHGEPPPCPPFVCPAPPDVHPR